MQKSVLGSTHVIRGVSRLARAMRVSCTWLSHDGGHVELEGAQHLSRSQKVTLLHLLSRSPRKIDEGAKRKERERERERHD